MVCVCMRDGRKNPLTHREHTCRPSSVKPYQTLQLTFEQSRDPGGVCVCVCVCVCVRVCVCRRLTFRSRAANALSAARIGALGGALIACALAAAAASVCAGRGCGGRLTSSPKYLRIERKWRVAPEGDRSRLFTTRKCHTVDGRVNSSPNVPAVEMTCRERVGCLQQRLLGGRLLPCRARLARV